MKADFLPAIDTPISDVSFFIFIEIILGLLIHICITLSKSRKIGTVNLYFLFMCFFYLCGLGSMVFMRFVPNSDVGTMKILKRILTQTISVYAPIFTFLIVQSIVLNNCVSKWMNLIFIIPTTETVLVLLNDYKELFVSYDKLYSFLSLLDSEWYMYVYEAASVIFLLVSAILLFVFAGRRNSKNAWYQALIMGIGSLIPIAITIVSAYVPEIKGNITINNYGYIAQMLCLYIGIYGFHALDLVPNATKYILNWIGDGYVILDTGLKLIDYNHTFECSLEQFCSFTYNKPIDRKNDEKSTQVKAFISKLCEAIEKSRSNKTPVSYEQSIMLPDGNSKHSYVIEVSPLEIEKRLGGFVILFKDITEIKKNLEEIQQSKEQLMERDRLAMLGQMAAGFAHNLKTPIMSIAGATSAVDALAQEISESVGDPEITPEDYRDIVNELYDWTGKIRTSCSYMSDIISAIKGQAANAVFSEEREFSVREVTKYSETLMRHELTKNGCTLEFVGTYDSNLTLVGDMNCLTQILNNLISNAIDALKKTEDKRITVKTEQLRDCLKISVIDYGPSLSPLVREKLFKEMITTKGIKGTGLGLYISSTIIHGKFGGEMWASDMEEGCEIGFTIPIK